MYIAKNVNNKIDDVKVMYYKSILPFQSSVTPLMTAHLGHVNLVFEFRRLSRSVQRLYSRAILNANVDVAVD